MRMRAQGKAIAPEQIEAVWAHYELGKKRICKNPTEF